MLLRDKTNAHIVEIADMAELTDLFRDEVSGRYHYGEEVQEPEIFKKSNLAFLSGEPLPRCWTDPHYRDEEITR